MLEVPTWRSETTFSDWSSELIIHQVFIPHVTIPQGGFVYGDIINC